MEEPQGQNRFFERCARLLLELSDELERNLYIEAIVRQYHRYGISVEDLRKRVNTLAMKGTPIEQRQQPKTVEARQAQKKESAADKAQKLIQGFLIQLRNICLRGILSFLYIMKWQKCFLNSMPREM